MSAPDIIYLQWYGDAPTDIDLSDLEPDESDVSWCVDKIFNADIEYIQKHKYDDLLAALKNLVENTEEPYMDPVAEKALTDARALLSKIKAGAA